MLEILVRRYEDFEASAFGCCDELTVLESRPTAFVSRLDRVSGQRSPQRSGRALIEQDFHLRDRH